MRSLGERNTQTGQGPHYLCLPSHLPIKINLSCGMTNHPYSSVWSLQGSINTKPLYHICSETLEKLNKGVEVGGISISPQLLVEESCWL